MRCERPRGAALRFVRRTVVAVGMLAAAARPAAASGPPPRPIGADDGSGTAAAVVVDGRAPLVHTAQLLPPRGPVTAGDQAEALLDRLADALREGGSGFDRLVKVNVYAARSDALDPFRKALARRTAGKARPALAQVVGQLRRSDALLALDAVAVADPAGRRAPAAGPALSRMLPPGPRVYVSGQAETGPTLTAAARKTLDGLDATLAFLKLRRSDVVQVKVFLRGMPDADAVARVIGEFFGAATPPVVFVEWTMPLLEIELVAAGGPEGGAGPVEFLTPPALKPSPVFSRVARVNRGDLIYVSGLYGPAGAPGARQVEAVFGSLGKILAEAGSDFRHLVKATYYISDDDAGRALNDLRPRYFDPARPPAASKAGVADVGAERRSLTLDMIAVPAPRAR